ncbi:MAG: GTPase Era, partial [Lachnospiraceae bacterium]|nr:GTPase Era [Lachnospiraceae bacterium]
INDVDVILWLVEPEPKVGEGDRRIAEDLKDVKKPVILVINKVDTIRHEQILPVIDAYKDLMDYTEIIPLSAREREGVETLLDLIYNNLSEGPMFYDEDTLTDQPVRAIVSEIIREKALHCLSDEVPHGIAVQIDKMKYRHTKGGAICDIDATIICERDSHKGIIIGKQGAMIKKIGQTARYEIERLIDSRANLKLFVKVKKDWRESDFLVKSYSLSDSDFDI